jgi:hypothetical protein
MQDTRIYLTAAEVDEGILLGHFPRLSDIPEQFLDDNLAIEWLKFAGSPIERHYAQVPQALRSSAFLKFAAFNGCNVLKDTSPAQTECYRELVHLCLMNDCQALRDVHPKFRTVQTLKVLKTRFNALDFLPLIQDIEWVGPAMSDELVSELCDDDFSFVLQAPASLLRKDLVDYVDLRRPKVITSLRINGRLDLLAAKLAKEGWPKNYDLTRPASLEDVVARLPGCTPRYYPETLYLAFVMTYPIDQVVPAMNTVHLKKLLLEMYSIDELRPHMKQDNGLKAVLLDDALGL